jgi:hypothetical protein
MTTAIIVWLLIQIPFGVRRQGHEGLPAMKLLFGFGTADVEARCLRRDDAGTRSNGAGCSGRGTRAAASAAHVRGDVRFQNSFTRSRGAGVRSRVLSRRSALRPPSLSSSLLTSSTGPASPSPLVCIEFLNLFRTSAAAKPMLIHVSLSLFAFFMVKPNHEGVPICRKRCPRK